MQKTILSILFVLSLSAVVLADTKVTSRQTSGGQTYDNTIYIKGKRQRSEMQNGQMISLTQCDLKRNVQIAPATKTYLIQPFGDATAGTAATPGNSPAAGVQEPMKKGGVITSTISTRDTGERKQMFGYTARHIMTTMAMESSPDACSQNNTKMEIDGWYIDAAFALDCDMTRAYVPPQRPVAGGGCRDRYEQKTIGLAKKGFPVWEKMTMFGPNGVTSFSTINEVVDFSQATLDQSLFEIPEGYREVQDYAALYGMPTSPSMTVPNPSSASTANVPSTSTQPSNSAAAAATVGPKKAGVIRIGVVAVKPGAVAEGMNAGNLAGAVQTTLSEKLKAPNVEAVPIQATVLKQIEDEARQKECDYLVFTTVTHKKGGGGFGGVFSSAASTVAGNIPYGSTTAAVATNTATSAVVADIKAKDELTVDVRLEKPGAGYPKFSKQFKGKAKSAGEDIVSPATTQAAQALIEAATKP
jgi:hypothetical protein